MSLVETWLAPFVITVVGGLVIGYLQHLRKRSTTTPRPTEHKVTQPQGKHIRDAMRLVTTAASLSSSALALMVIPSLLIIFVLFLFKFHVYDPMVLLTARVYLLSSLASGLLLGCAERDIVGVLLEIVTLFQVTVVLVLLFSAIGWILGLGFEATAEYYFDAFFDVIFNHR